MTWSVEFTAKAAKQFNNLPEDIQKRARALVDSIERTGPVQGTWKNYSKLGPNEHHCHLTYRYVMVWEVKEKTIKLIEVTYVGSREKAPY